MKVDDIIYDVEESEKRIKVERINLKVKVLRNKKERKDLCGYGSGEISSDKKCGDCDDEKKICLYIEEEVNNFWSSYVTGNYELIKLLEKMCMIKVIEKE